MKDSFQNSLDKNQVESSDNTGIYRYVCSETQNQSRNRTGAAVEEQDAQ